MSDGLPIGSIIRGSIALQPTAAPARNFGVELILGDSDVIDVIERKRFYTDATGLVNDFGVNSPEYQAGALFFSQNPTPQTLMVGRWASTGSKGLLRGSIRSPAQMQMSNFTGINNGALSISVDGLPHVVTGVNLTAVSNLNAIAAAIENITGGYAQVSWDAVNKRFLVESNTTGTLSSVGFAVAPGSGTDLGPLLGLNNVPNSGAYSVVGLAAEDLTATAALFDDLSSDWYMLSLASTATPSNSDLQKVAAFIESTGDRVFGITNEDPSTLDPNINTDIASIIKTNGYARTQTTYTSQTDFAISSVHGRAATVDFAGQGTVITLNFKRLPGVAPEFLTESQRAALRAKNCNAYLAYNNNTAIYQEGWMGSGDFFDVIQCTDAMLNVLQTNIWNLYYTTTTKIAQTDSGLDQIINAMSAGLQQFVDNGTLYPGGTWQGPDLPPVIKNGDTLPKGFEIYVPKLSTQSQADRSARKTPLIQAACKLAGAFHSADFLISVNR